MNKQTEINLEHLKTLCRKITGLSNYLVHEGELNAGKITDFQVALSELNNTFDLLEKEANK